MEMKQAADRGGEVDDPTSGDGRSVAGIAEPSKIEDRRLHIGSCLEEYELHV